jgi:hypothetical protein
VLFGRPRAASRSFVDLRETYLERLAAGGTAGRFAPTARPVPSDPAEAEAWRERILEGWRVASSGLPSVVRRWDDAALDRHRLPHPLLGRLTAREMLFFTLYHNAHHLNLVAERASGRRFDR